MKRTLRNRIFLTLATVLALSPAIASMQMFNSSGVELGHAAKFQCSTGLTCTFSNGKLSAVASSLSMSNGETITNPSDDIIRVTSNDEHMTFQIMGYEAKNAVLQLWADEGDDAADKYSFTVDTSGVLTAAQAGAAFDLKMAAFEATDAKLTLQADESDDNGDDWEFKVAASGNALTISNDTSGSQVAKLTLSTAGAMSSVVSITGSGAGALSGYLQNQVASTTVAITASQCGSTFVSNSADVMDLPEASTVLGCRLTFVCGTADDFDINPADGTDQIGVIYSVTGANTTTTISPAAGDAIRCTDADASITLQAVGADKWAPIGAASGAWTDIN